MALANTILDPREMYGGYNAQERYEYERAMHYRRQEDEYRRMQQQAAYNPYSGQQQGKIVNPTPKQDPKDPLAFLTKTDNKILLTGEAS
jgi:hypothetical protein